MPFNIWAPVVLNWRGTSYSHAKMIRRAFTIWGFVLLIPLTPLVLLGTLRLYSSSSADYDRQRVQREILPSMRFMRAEIENGSAENMDLLFPEGYFFNYALYGLTWVEVGLREEVGSPLYEEALRESRWALANLETKRGKRGFQAGLDPPYGAFYLGWKTWLHGGIIKLQPADRRDAEEIRRLEEACELLAKSYREGARPFPPTYNLCHWPMDGIVGAAALRLHDRVLPSKYGELLDRWMATAIASYDKDLPLLPHQVPPGNYQVPRAIAQSVVCRFAYEIDPAWGREMYHRYREHFFRTPLGVPGMREYPPGYHSHGDVDSGPLILGLSPSASAIMIGTAQLLGDNELAVVLTNAAEAAGMPLSWGGKKFYLFGLVPVADGFIAWSKASQPWAAQETAPPATAFQQALPGWWRLRLHAITLLPLALGWWLVLRSHRKILSGRRELMKNPRRIIAA